jgi:hypothetical protein
LKIVCLGNTAQDTINAANARLALTTATSQNMLDYFNEQGGNTPLVAKEEPGFFEKAWGMFGKLGTIASTTPVTTAVVAPSGPPIVAMVSIGAAAFLLYNLVKK